MIAAGLSLLGAGVLVLVWLGGRKTGRKAHLWEINNDPHYRRELLEKLATLENCKIVGKA
jgi:hypothetical protein